MEKDRREKLWTLIEENYLSMEPEEIQHTLARHMEYSQAKTRTTAIDYDWYKSFAYSIRDRVMERWNDTQSSYYRENAKRVYYLSLEFLTGRLLHNTLINLDIYEQCKKALDDLGYSIEDLLELESDAGLGNGGLGRLAACFLDSMATLQLPGYGYGLRYDYGIFEQNIVDGFQVEKPENWLRYGYPWEIVRPEYCVNINFNGTVNQYYDKEGRLQFSWNNTEKIVAVPYDIPVPGYKNDTINTLRLWSARATEDFDLKEFNEGDYIHAVEQKVLSENITKVLYPKDDFPPGKELRLKQEYFFVAATVCDIIRRFKVSNSSFDNFADKVAIQLNDTHPAVAIPELMRVFIDQEKLSWETAWNICVKTFGYTNHTIMPEACEKWTVELFGRLLPRHLQIIYEINQRFLEDVKKRYGNNNELLKHMSIIEESPIKSVRMANLAIVGSHSINGVAALHTELIKQNLFTDFYNFMPEKFNNKTNGITQRRWLKLCNPMLSEQISHKIGEKWVTDLYDLKNLIPYADDKEFKNEWENIKIENKKRLANYIKKNNRIEVNINSIFDCQVKRIHEYKRQLLNALHIITLYNRIKDDPRKPVVPRTIIFGGKAAPGYYMAKLIIKLINSIADVVNSDPQIGDKLKVVFLENYRVSLAQKIFPAAELSEQISTAGFEASGTGNMKFALNGALTIGTLDGANVEIKEEVGDDNIFIFGLKAEQVIELKQRGYNPWEYYINNQQLKRVIDMIGEGYFNPQQRDLFRPIIDSLLNNGDKYMLLADYSSYIDCQEKVSLCYLNQDEWTKKSILNSANSGKFSSDRTIMEYAKEIWNVIPVKPIEKKERHIIKDQFNNKCH